MSQYRNKKSQRPRNRIVAAMLAAFGGTVGAHKFYLNQGGQGIFFIMMLIFTGNMFGWPITTFFGIFDAFRLLSMSDEDFHRKYNRGARVNPTHRDSKIEKRREQQVLKSRQPRSSTPSREAIKRANPFKQSGIKKYRDFDLEGAIVDFNKGLEINSQDVALHFNIANAYSLTEQKEKAYQHLDKAVQLGFNDFELLNTKDDLAFVRIQQEWDTFKENGYRLKRGMMQGNTALDEQMMQTDDVLLSQLNKLAELRKKGLLSEEEFVLERKKLMSRR